MVGMYTERDILPLVPAQAFTALDVLESAGFEAWLVGGFVRDAFLGRPSYDIDIASSATPYQAQEAFISRGYIVHETGMQHGTITAIVDDMSFEVTMFRRDGSYKDARRPLEVFQTDSIAEDLARRDFTVNAMAWHPERGLLDPFRGLNDLSNQTIRCVGDPVSRFSEDALRVLRGCRFKAQLGFKIDVSSWRGMLRTKSLLTKISAERTLHEMDKLLCGDYAYEAIMDTIDVLCVVLPELQAAKNFDQRTHWHIYDVLEHTAYAVKYSPATPLSRWAALLHDIGKPACFFTSEDGCGHFYGHPRVSEVIARGIGVRLKMPVAMQENLCSLVKIHDDVIEPTHKAVKRTLMKFDGNVELFKALCDLKRADSMAQAPEGQYRIQQAERLKEICDEVIASREPFSLKALAVNGHDMIENGIAQGPAVGEALKTLLSAVIDERVPNERRALLRYLRNR